MLNLHGNLLTELQESYQVHRLSSKLERPINKDVKVLLLIAPEKLPDISLYYIDQYIMRGGKLILFLDSYAVANSGQGNTTKFNFKIFLDRWKVHFHDNLIVSDDILKSVFEGKNQKTILGFENLPKIDLFTGVNKLFFAHSGYFSYEKDTKLQVDYFLQATEKSTLFNLNNNRVFSRPKDTPNFPDFYKVIWKILIHYFKKIFPKNYKKKHIYSIAKNEVYMLGDVDLLYDRVKL